MAPGKTIGEGRSQQQLSVNWSHMLNMRSKNVVLTKYTYQCINTFFRLIMLLLENICLHLYPLQSDHLTFGGGGGYLLAKIDMHGFMIPIHTMHLYVNWDVFIWTRYDSFYDKQII